MFSPAYPIDTLATTAAAVSATRPSSGSDGVSTAAFRGFGRITIVLDADAARTLADPTGGTAGVELWAYESSQWSLIGILNDGADISIVANTQGWAVTLDLGRSYDRLAVAGTPSAGTITQRFVPIEVGR